MVNVTVIQQEPNSSVVLDIPQESTVGLLKSLIEIDLAIPSFNQILYVDDNHLDDDSQEIIQAGITDGSLVLVINKQPHSTEVEDIPNLTSSTPPMPPPSNNTSQGGSQGNTQMPNNYELMRQYQSALNDPFSVKAQEFIERSINRNRVSENYSLAREFLPESFANVYMLYINVEVNKVKIQAFVDTGAQSTIMSYSCAKKCNLSQLIDDRVTGIAKGIGTTRIMGKIHLADLKIGNSYYAASFVILEDGKVDFLLGLDMLKRYQCSIDLFNNVLKIRDDSVPFLAEKDIEKPFTPTM